MLSCPEDYKPVGKRGIKIAIALALALVAVLSVLAVYFDGMQHVPASNSSKSETLLVDAGFTLASSDVSINIGLQRGQTLTGSYSFNPEPPIHFFVGVTITNPQGNVVASYANATQDFSLTATSSGTYVAAFGCTTSNMELLPQTCNVTLSYKIIG